MRKVLAILVLIGWASPAAADGEWSTFKMAFGDEWASQMTFSDHQRCTAIEVAALHCTGAPGPWGEVTQAKAENAVSGETWIFDCRKLRALGQEHFDQLEPQECFRRRHR